jgi:hypothetical protein
MNMRPEIEAALARWDAADDDETMDLAFAELRAIDVTDAECREIILRLEESVENARIDAEEAHRKADDFERQIAGFAEWADAEKAKGRPKAELIFGNFMRETGRVSQEQIDAHEKWRKGPHCPEDQVYLDAMDEVSSLREDHIFTEDELIGAMVKRMGPEFGEDEQGKVEAAKHISERGL